MSDSVQIKLATLAALVIVAAVTGATVALFRWLIWWPALLLQTRFRPGLVFTRLLIVLGLAAIAPLLLLPTGLDIAAMILLWLTIVPGLAGLWARAAAWKSDSESDHEGAAAIRQSISERRGEKLLADESKPWRTYIVDVARLRRRMLYQPPGH